MLSLSNQIWQNTYNKCRITIFKRILDTYKNAGANVCEQRECVFMENMFLGRIFVW